MIFRKQPDAEPRYTIDDLLLTSEFTSGAFGSQIKLCGH
jgi:hypothetical protein